MVTLTWELTTKIAKALSITAVLALLFDQLLTFGDGRLQSFAVFSFYTFCILALFEYSPNKLFYVLAIPLLSQFVHIFQRYSFPAGANSLWRLFPFLVLDTYLIDFILSTRGALLSPNQKTFILSWILFSLFFMVISPNLEMIAGGGITLYILTIPGYFAYLNITCRAVDFQAQLEKHLCLLFVILAAGTFGLIYFGAGYQGSDNLLVTRNIADTNVTMAYFILLWPFAILYLNRQDRGWMFIPFFALIFLAIVGLSFSRGALMLILPYLCMTLLFAKKIASWIPLVLLVSCLITPVIFPFFQEQDIGYFWSLRFSDIFSTNSFWNQLQASSGRLGIQEIAYDLFLQRPFTGHGIGSFEILGPGFREAHSLFYTMLAELGILGTIFMYACFLLLGSSLIGSPRPTGSNSKVLLLSLAFYLVFNHTVGSAFVIIPAKSISVNCIAPMLLLCLYFYTKDTEQAHSACPDPTRL
jgi:O-antigen ligase